MIRTVIAAVAANGVIGQGGTMPWDCPADMKHFMSTTMGHPCIVGRKTYESFRRRPLPGRLNIVLTKQPDYATADGVIVVGSYDEAVRHCEQIGAARMFVCGGAQIYRITLPQADEMILTHLPDHVSGDSFFPEWDPADWEETDSRAGEDGVHWKTYRRRRRDREP